jgi:hypothetical protein
MNYPVASSGVFESRIQKTESSRCAEVFNILTTEFRILFSKQSEKIAASSGEFTQRDEMSEMFESIQANVW